jgi:hypothetical protein
MKRLAADKNVCPTGMNPFSTRHIRPGALDYLFPARQSAAALVERLRAADWLGQIIGPHGSGKSTLLAALTPALAAAGRVVVSRQIRGREPGGRGQEPNTESLSGLNLDANTQLIIDGYEQLSWWSRRRIENVRRRHGAGLLVTAHQDLGLPTLFVTQPTLELAQQVVGRLLDSDDQTITIEDITAAWETAEGNLRETLFKLFDVYQARRG